MQAVNAKMRSVGDGPPLLMLSGTGGRGAVFLGMPRAWRMAYRCLMPDPSPPYDTQKAAHALGDRLCSMGIDAYHVLGVSLGGCIAQHLAVQFPSRVLTLCATYAALDAQTAETVRTLRDARLGEPDAVFLPRWHRALFGEGIPMPEGFSTGNSPQAFAAQLDAACQHDARSMLAQIECPTRVTAGEADTLIPATLSADLARPIPGATFETHPGGHMHWMQLLPKP